MYSNVSELLTVVQYIRRYERKYGDPQEKLVPRVPPFKATQGHIN